MTGQAAARSRRREWALVGTAFAVLALVAALWLAVDRRPPEWDHANHLERAIVCSHDLVAGDVRQLLERSSFYPPLVLCGAGLLALLAPSDVVAAQAVVLLFLGIGMAAVYLLGRSVAGGSAGVAAAWLFGSAPFVVFSSLRFQLDLPLAAMVAVAVLVLVRTERFRRPGWSLAAGVVFGLGMLTKPPFALYVLPAVAWAAAGARGRRALGNGALAALAAGALGVPWYGPRLFGLPAQVASRSFAQAAESGHPDPLSWSGLAFYPTWFITQFGVVAVLLCCAGLVLAGRRRQWWLLVALLVPLAVVELLQNKNLRYTLPLLPLAAVVAGMAVAEFRGRARAAVAAVLIVAGALQVSATALRVPPPVRLPGLGVPWVLASPPTRVDWRHREILALLARESGGQPRTVSVVPNDNYFSVSNFRYYGLRDGLPLRFERAWDGEPLGVEYMILKSGDVGPEWTAERPRRIAERLAGDPHLARVFPVIGEFSLPDGSLATVRARRVPDDLAGAPAALARAVDAAFRSALTDVAREVEGLQIRLTYDDSIRQGRIARAEVAAAAATVAEFQRRGAARLRVRDLRLVAEDVLVNPFSVQAGAGLGLLDAGRIRLEGATILAADLQAFLGGLKAFRRATVALGDGAAVFTIGQPGPDLRARVRFEAGADGLFALVVERVRLGGIPVPDLLVDWVVRHYDPAPKLARRLPFPVEIGRITVTDGAIRIATDPGR